MKKQNLSEEFKRMQELAGISLNEITVNPPHPTYNEQISRVKEWLEFAFDGEQIDPTVEAEINNLLRNHNKMTEELFREIWGVYNKKYSTGDTGADWDAFESTFMWVMDGDESHFDNY